MKFEEHEGKLFRMLEEPDPLTDDAELPVLVRLIQDDTMLGKANKRSCHPDTLAQKIICSSSKLTDDGLFMDGNYTYCYEIIGTLVEEGSKDWALYQMMQGKKVTKRHLINHIYWHYDARPHLKCISEYNCGTLQIMVLPEIWLTTAEPTGWQLYKETKPEPAKEPIADCDNCKHRCTKSNIDYCQMYEPKPTFKVGDWVKYDIDYYVQVIEPSSYDDLMKMSKDRTLCRTLSGINVYPYTSLLTKASHSEVVVPITISGTVRPAYNEDGPIDDEQFQLLPNGSWDGTEMFISFDALDSHTRKLVESLLKAQEEEK